MDNLDKYTVDVDGFRYCTYWQFPEEQLLAKVRLLLMDNKSNEAMSLLDQWFYALQFKDELQSILERHKIYLESKKD